MIEVEARADVTGVDLDEIVRVIRATCDELDVERATVGVMVVPANEMARINGEHRAKPEPTDVLAFPVDGPEVLGDGWPEDGPPPELGDIVICPEAAQEPHPVLAIHGLLHLLGYDHETDMGEMLQLQDALVDRLLA